MSFAYPIRPKHIVLDSFNGTFVARHTTFIIGQSGSGKSTIGQILMKFYQPLAGSICIDGRSLEELDTSWVRRNVTLVEQASVLFHGNMFDNIALGSTTAARASMEEVKAAAEFALLQQTIRDLPKGLETVVGVIGSSLSGGQRQRVALARARLRDTPILILDESTSALDHITRGLMLSAIRTWRKRKTTLIISHDMAQIQDDDYVFVLHHGKLVQEGYGVSIQPVNTSNGEARPLKTPSASQSESPFSSRSVASSPHSSSIKAESQPDPHELRDDFVTLPAPVGTRYIPSIFADQRTPFGGARASVSFGTTLAAASPFLGTYYSPSSGSSGSPRRATKSQSPWSNPRPARAQPTLKTLERPNLEGKPPQSVSADDAIELLEFTGLNAVQNRLSTGRGKRRRAPLLSPGSPTPLLGDAEHVAGFDDVQAEADIAFAADTPSMRKILMTVWPHLNHQKRFWCVLGFSGAVVHAVATPLFSWIFSKLLSTFFNARTGNADALKWSLSIVVVAVVEAVACFSLHVLLDYCGQNWVDSIRQRAMSRILDQPKSFFAEEANGVARLTQSLDRDAEEMRNILGRFAAFLLIALVMMTVAMTWSLAVCWKLTLGGLSISPISYAITRGFQTVSAAMEAKSNHAADVCADVLNEAFANIKTVRALTLEEYFRTKHSEAIITTLKVGLRRAAYCGFFFGISEAVMLFTNALIFYYGAVLAASREFSIDDILLVFSMLLFSMSNLTAIVAFIPQIQASKDTAARLLRLSDLPSDSHEHQGTAEPPVIGDIRCNNLSFNYDPRDVASRILHDVTATFPAGCSTCLVGGSGSGKSTIASLLLRLYPIPDVTSHPTSHHHRHGPSHSTVSSISSDASLPAASPAAITLSPSQPINTISTHHLRNLIATVPQTPVLFPATIAQNIAYALPPNHPNNHPSATETAARQAGIHEFVASLPGGYQTPIGDGGVPLSGGQAQRIAIARALVREPQVLILDEATSALDPASAEVVRDTIARLMKEGVRAQVGGHGEENRRGKITVLVITHSRQMMEICERAVVLERGRVVEEGRFEDLVERRWGKLRQLLSGGEWVREDHRDCDQREGKGKAKAMEE